MRGIGGILGLLVVALIVALVYRFYFAQSPSGAALQHPVQTIDTIGVKNDLLAIGQAERIYQAGHASYASLDDLVSSGALAVKKSERDGYTYGVEFSTDSFRVIATCPAATAPGCTNYTIDQTMTVQTSP
jgi:hypothetical protein